MSREDSFTVCILRSATRQSNSKTTSDEELARRLQTLGVKICGAYKPIMKPSEHGRLGEVVKLIYVDYFTSAPILNQSAEVYVAMPNDMSLISALSGILSSSERKQENQPLIILTPSRYWKGLIDWFEETAVRSNDIDQSTFNRLLSVDTVEEVVDRILRHRAEIANRA